jgi:putative methyltransferase (TIGR04325 family)
VVFEKTKRLRDRLAAGTAPLELGQSDTRLILGLALSASQRRLNVLDFGGACGAHYFLARAFLPSDVALRWHVVETPAMAQRARALENGELRFFDRLEQAGNELETIDLVLSSSTLQYVEKPYEYLEELLRFSAPHALLTRVALTAGPTELVTVQRSSLSANGPGPMPEHLVDGSAMYPVNVVRKDRFEAILAKSYDILLTFDEQQAVHTVNGRQVDQYGYFARARSS